MDLIFKKVDLHCQINNSAHHTSDIREDRLIIRRGQSFLMTLDLPQPFNPDSDTLTITVVTGLKASEERGTRSVFSIPKSTSTSPEAKVVWKVELHESSSLQTGSVTLAVTPAPDAPIGEYFLSLRTSHTQSATQQASLGSLVLLFNPWSSDDRVYLPDEGDRQEYVMNEQGIVYRGSNNYITSMIWDYGQFEEDIVEICLKILDVNPKHLRDPVDDVSARCNPIYVSRVVSAMINSSGDRGVLVGNWDGQFRGGVLPSHWGGSVDILQRWRNYGCHPVKYGQCWVFAGVMCTVLRCLGIPCRVVTNYQSAHDTDKSLTIDAYYSDHGFEPLRGKDSVWNYHVWVEGWMKRPDLDEDGSYDGWQALDPTPQEKSGGVYCCGPASVTAVYRGETHLKYDVPFVFAEINADCVDWLVMADGSKQQFLLDTKRVGQNISTKSVGSSKRYNITDSYKHREGTEKERAIFKHATSSDPKKGLHRKHKENKDEEVNGDGDGATPNDGTPNRATANDGTPNGATANDGTPNGATANDGTPNGATANDATLYGATPNGGTPNEVHVPQEVSMTIKEESMPVNGQDINLKLTLHSEDQTARSFFIHISTQAMRYTGTPATNIHTDRKEEMLQPGQELSVPIVIPFSVYGKHLLDCNSLKVSVIATDQRDTKYSYLAETDIVPQDPPISVTVQGQAQLYHEVSAEVLFLNPIGETLENCTLTLSGSGLFKHNIEYSLPNLKPRHRVRVSILFVPYKVGTKTLVVDFDCSAFRDIKASCTVDVKPA